MISIATATHSARDASPAREAALTHAGIKAVLNIFQRWGLADAQASALLGGVGVSTVRRWRQCATSNSLRVDVRRDLQDRLSLILGIYKALQILFPDAAQADGWVQRPSSSPVFAGRSALAVMLDGGVDDLHRVRRYLDAQRG
ncbi:MbcA/ParS/Xre antitoxin family protein [Nevskia sp.]|uniref:MbcA/ParS/Xre antitoxin family protein n=1 Tax=Nevskia sp. TaxID=1929292 RepID=UPI0025D3120B|nr:MbcA/ParS/Xre antitoxin family protein [Nevskia sp.]